jgi:hypothetical protein
MPGTCLRCLWIHVVIAGLSVAGVASGQAPRSESRDLLEQARRMNEIAAQKVEADVRTAIREADKLRSTDAAAAVERLKTALSLVEDDTALSQSRRDYLVRTLKSRIRLLGTDKTEDRETIKPSTRARLEDDLRTTDQERISRTLDTIRSLRRDGKFDEAQRLADNLAQRYPDNPAVQASAKSTAVAGQAATTRRYREDLDRRLTAFSRSVDRSGMPAVTDMEFPKDWRERVKNRTTKTPLTAKEKAILQALNSTASVKFKGERFEEVIKYLSDLMGQPIVLDRAALREAQVDYETPVSFDTNGQKISVRTILRKVLSEFGLAYVIKDQTIEVTSTLNAQKTMVTRAYFIGDLLDATMGLPGLTALQLFGPKVTEAQMLKQVNQIIDTIKASIDPASWDNNGGGTISFHAPTMSLLIRQSAEVHSMLGGMMK